MLEGYFVRTLGMHRVYNSAFMHMLRDEDGAAYRKLIRETLEFDPEILKRYVNFMSNPDEETAIEQFGTGDKYVGVAMVMATLPGLPMLGHGQVEGFRERYGMEFRRARWDEPVDDMHAGHFAYAIVPLLRRRSAFSGTDRFRLYDAHSDDGQVDQNVYAYSNGSGPDRSLVLVHHHFGETTVRIDWSIAAAQPGGGKPLTRVRLAEALELPAEDDAPVRFLDPRAGYELTRTAGELRREGLRVNLGPYEARVLLIAGPDEPEPEPVPPSVKAKPAARRQARRVSAKRSPAADRSSAAKRTQAPERSPAPKASPARKPRRGTG
jgi:hypothetical protein